MWIKQNHTALRTRASDAELSTLRIEIEPTVVTIKFTKDLTTEHNWFVYLCAFFDQNLVGAKFLAICQSWHCSNIAYKQYIYINMNFKKYIYIYMYTVYIYIYIQYISWLLGGFTEISFWCVPLPIQVETAGFRGYVDCEGRYGLPRWLVSGKSFENEKWTWILYKTYMVSNEHIL